MSSGARQIVQIAEEVTNGVTPSPFDREAIPFTEATLDQTVNKTDSASIKTGRIAQQGSITSATIEGDLNAEAEFGTYDELIAGVAFNDWAANTLTFGGDIKKSFSILRGYDDIQEYYTFGGVHVNTFSLDVPEEGLITFSFGLMGKNRVHVSDVAPAGTVTPTPDMPKLSSVGVGDILVDGQSVAGVACISALTFEWDNSSQVQRCLGQGLSVGAIIAGMANGTGTVTMAWSKEAARILDKQFENGLVAFVIPFGDSLGNLYTLTLPQVEITGSLPSGGGEDILQASIDYRVVNQAPILTRQAYVALTGISISPSSDELEVDETSQLTVSFTPNTATNKNVSYSTSNSAVATVDQNGLVTAVAVGTATITATSSDGGFTATSEIEVV